MPNHRPDNGSAFEQQMPQPDYHQAYQSTAIDNSEDDFEEDEMELADPWQRILARLIDYAFSLPFAGLGGFLFFFAFFDFVNKPHSPGSEYWMLGYLVLPIAIGAAIQAVFMVRSGQSIGKKMIGIRVVNAEGELPGFARYVLLREGLFYIIMILLYFIPLLAEFIQFAWLVANLVLLFDPARNRQTLPDMLAKTYVVKV